MQKKIADFIVNNKIATFCCVDQTNLPYCFNAFYAFDEANFVLFFKSSSQSMHSQILAKNPGIAGTILPEKIDFLGLKGIQFTGTAFYNETINKINADAYYHKRFAFARVIPGHVWCIELKMAKMTDNSAVFGNKLIWNKTIKAHNEVAFGI